LDQTLKFRYVVEEKVVGSAFGMAMSLQQVGVTIVPLIIGAIEDKSSISGGYVQVSILLAGLSFVGLIFSFLIYNYDLKHGKVLLATDAKRFFKVNYD
jgi:hypothetical protein